MLPLPPPRPSPRLPPQASTRLPWLPLRTLVVPLVRYVSASRALPYYPLPPRSLSSPRTRGSTRRHTPLCRASPGASAVHLYQLASFCHFHFCIPVCGRLQVLVRHPVGLNQLTQRELTHIRIRMGDIVLRRIPLFPHDVRWATHPLVVPPVARVWVWRDVAWVFSVSSGNGASLLLLYRGSIPASLANCL